MKLDDALASRFAQAALGHVTREYPHKLDHVMNGDGDARTPRELHPIFFGSFDWHSCVHGWWTLLTLRRLFPNLPEAQAIATLADESFTTAKVAAERSYLDRANSSGFVRPYGWAWLLYLHLEADRHQDRGWSQQLEPLACAFAQRWRHYLAILTYPIRVGTHFNTAFGITLSLKWAERFDPELADAMRTRALEWFGNDRDCQAWEPGGDEFLSPALSVALLISKVMRPERFAGWFAGFLPRTSQREPTTLFTPASVSDRSDGKIAHLDGLNLSRAWAWNEIGPLLGANEERVAHDTASAHFAAALPHVTGDYMGEHWLASFALLALRPDA